MNLISCIGAVVGILMMDGHTTGTDVPATMPVLEAIPNYDIAYLCIPPDGGDALLLGGQYEDEHLTTWRRSDDGWRGVGVGPKNRSAASLAYHAPTRTFVLFGGRIGNKGESLSDGVEDWTDECWVYRDDHWLRFAGDVPPARFAAAMGYDSARQLIVLFGGRGDARAQGYMLDDTWTFDGRHWRTLAIQGPCVRYAPAMAFDDGSKSMILFGGYTNGRGYCDDTWRFDGKTWSRLESPTRRPHARFSAAMASEPGKGVLLFGGFVADSDLWRWHEGRWSVVADLKKNLPSDNVPQRRRAAAMAYDPQRKGIVIFGEPGEARDDTATWWLFRGDRWVRLR